MYERVFEFASEPEKALVELLTSYLNSVIEAPASTLPPPPPPEDAIVTLSPAALVVRVTLLPATRVRVSFA